MMRGNRANENFLAGYLPPVSLEGRARIHMQRVIPGLVPGTHAVSPTPANPLRGRIFKDLVMVGLDPTIHAGTQEPAPAAESRSCQRVSQPVRGSVDPRVKPEDDVVLMRERLRSSLPVSGRGKENDAR